MSTLRLNDAVISGVDFSQNLKNLILGLFEPKTQQNIIFKKNLTQSLFKLDDNLTWYQNKNKTNSNKTPPQKTPTSDSREKFRTKGQMDGEYFI